MKSTHNKTEPRSAFTLLELLIVVSIIALMATLTVTVMANIADQANEAATVATLQKLNRLVEQRQEAFDRAFPAAEATWSSGFRDFVARVISSQQGVPVDRVRRLLERYSADAEVWNILGRKAAFRFEFPQRMAFSSTDPAIQGWDLLPEGSGGFNDNSATFGGNGIPDNIEIRLARPIARQQLIEAGNATPSDAQITAQVTANWAIHVSHEEQARADASVHSTESSELLYFMLMHSGTFGASDAGESDFKRSEIADTDGDGFPEFVDAWGNPLRFYRWPTRLIDPSLPLSAFTSGNLPVLGDQDEMTDLQMTISVDGTPEVLGENNGRTVDNSERSVADFLIRGLPRRLEFTPAYIAAVSGTFPDRPNVRDVNIVIPPDALLRDPDDPAGLLYALLENGLPLGGATINIDSIFNETQYHTPDTFHAPLIVSAGVDEVLGLQEPCDTANRGHLAMYDLNADGNTTPAEPSDFAAIIDQISDNLTNRNRRAGAGR